MKRKKIFNKKTGTYLEIRQAIEIKPKKEKDL